MGKYIEGFVLVVPKDKRDDYRTMAEEGRDSWMKHGALQYFECINDDLSQEDDGANKSRAFEEMASAGADEDVWFSFIVFESKEKRDEINAKVMEEMGAEYAEKTDFVMPFEMGKMAKAGFEVLVEG